MRTTVLLIVIGLTTTGCEDPGAKVSSATVESVRPEIQATLSASTGWQAKSAAPASAQGRDSPSCMRKNNRSTVTVAWISTFVR